MAGDGTPGDRTPDSVAVPDSAQGRGWQAVRLRLATADPWLHTALYRATPVSRPGSGTVDADRWGRLYVDFSLEDSAGIDVLARQVRSALRGWLDGTTGEQPWHAPLSDERFPAATGEDTDRVARSTARQLLQQPDTRRRDREDAAWREFAQRHAGPPQISWQAALGGHLRATIASSSGKSDYSYSKRSRHSRPGLTLPGLVGADVNVAVVADISPSIVPDLPTVFAEIDRIASAAGVAQSAMTVLAVDHEVVATVPFRQRHSALVPREDGRTDMRVGMTAALALRPRPDVVIVLTDGFTPWPQHRPAVPVIVALIGPGTVLQRSTPPPPTWARTVRIDTESETDPT